MLAGDYTLEVIAASISFLGRNPSSGTDRRHKQGLDPKVQSLSGCSILPESGLKEVYSG
jgi:hypothetical protein